ncbi:hypothetical protein M2375_000928 [Comamonas sp. BIGb0152]|uniref:hypothetical protein n=1 Tax=Comamonas sp. BIGb0152 TaxID=2940601 RepID=UPI00216A23F9|nr:hypothetical protein [Comamonas sp. BIGb0152]MCS4292722.1 hypothetical protein [Comamonas sp. BIGb0152]
MNTPVQYIGRKPSYTDLLYGTGLTFAPNQVRSLPARLADKFLRHSDLFREEREGDEQQDEQAQTPEQSDTPPQQEDDTAALLAAAQKQQDEQAQKDLERAGLMDQVRTMTKPELQTLAKDRWNQVLAKNLTLDNTRERVLQFVDQYGAA